MAILRALKSGEKLTIYGDGRQVRDYLDADDLADAILRVAQGSNYLRGVWNVGSGKGHTILEIIDVVAEVVGQRPEVVFVPERPCDVKCAVLDTSKFSWDFEWVATTHLAESIRKIIDV